MAQQQGGYLSTDPRAGTPVQAPTPPAPAQGGYLSTDPTAGERAPAPQVQGPQHPHAVVGDFVKDFLTPIVKSFDPRPLGEMVQHPIQTAQALGQAQGNEFFKAKTAYEEGQYGQAMAHTLAWLVPVFGPMLRQSGEKIGQGQVAEGAGEIAGVVAPSLLAKMPRIQLTPRLLPANQAEHAAAQFGIQHGVPVDAATATGSRVVRGVQHLSDRSIGGGIATHGTQAAQDAGMSRVGSQLAERTHPAPVDPLTAGRGVRTQIEGRIASEFADANQAYTELRKIEADPKHLKNIQTGSRTEASGVLDAQGRPVTRTVPVFEQIAMPVDLRATKQALRPVYDRMKRQLPITQQRASAGFKAIENIINGKDYAPVSVVDLDLSAIKSIAREGEPMLRDMSQGLAAKAVRELDASVQRAVQAAGPDAAQALQRGRAATISKHSAADLLKTLREEPRQLFDQAIWSRDAGVDRLREVQKLAPGEMPKVARAYLDELLSTATSEGGFRGGAGLWSKWQQLGPQTKAILFGGNRAHIKDLDNFFLLAKRLADTPNPSGTATVVSLGAQGGLLVTNPAAGAAVTIGTAMLSKLLHSPRGVRLLTQGLSMPVGNSAAAAALAGQIAQAAEGDDREPPLIVRTPARARGAGPLAQHGGGRE